ncbi:hypothetical protein POSPLADRAFT_1040771 [Postia placenta MAD-698-R-SB12]|uniref:Uncharacterized protein n=1 Tax=Postia placenta MAD-698-R-SB12 TaxID=670580 RepID=A0A1X6MTR7_9APHY|nr:hypothetical protein POSPLADRAFT_1040771 [Postia placenta MAD-698-R-SB12]OSX59765.1 hypothetical protein POSPLADRAFT_1040771 [Postia placenta MAD-698-R-SB12]
MASKMRRWGRAAWVPTQWQHSSTFSVRISASSQGVPLRTPHDTAGLASVFFRLFSLTSIQRPLSSIPD